MKYWFVPSNDYTYRIGDSIKENHGVADWRQSYPFSVGDIVFVFKPKPENFIRYKMEVIIINIPEEKSIQKEKYWVDKCIYYEGLGNSKYVRFQLLEEYAADCFPLALLLNHGLSESHQSVVPITGRLLDFLLNNDKIDDANDYGVDYPVEDSMLYEGALMNVRTNKYERNLEARKECIKAKGAKCSICGFDFEKAYGSIGRGFIHVHHIVPISSIGKEYKLDVVRDLIPVCPNCHAMLHQKLGWHEAYLPGELNKYMESTAKEELPTTIIHIGKIASVDDVPAIKKLLLDNMTLLQKTRILDLMQECFLRFGEQYPNMDYKDWMHLVSNFVHEVTHRYELKTNDYFSYCVAEP